MSADSKLTPGNEAPANPHSKGGVARGSAVSAGNSSGSGDSSQALIDSLKKFIADQQPKAGAGASPGARPTLGQITVLGLFAANVVILYSFFPQYFEEDWIKLASKLLTVLFGGGFALSEGTNARATLLKYSADWRFAASMVALFVVSTGLLLGRMPWYSVPVSLDPKEAEVCLQSPEEPKLSTTDTTALLKGDRSCRHKEVDGTKLISLQWNNYRVRVIDGDRSADFLLSRWTVLWSTFGGYQALPLTAAFPISVHSNGATIDVDGDLPDRLIFEPQPPCKTGSDSRRLVCTPEPNDSVMLPPGTYNFTFKKNGCKDDPHPRIKLERPDQMPKDGQPQVLEFSCQPTT